MIVMRGPLGKALKRVVIVYGERDGEYPELDNAYALEALMLTKGYDVSVIFDEDYREPREAWVISLGGPVVNDVSERYNDDLPVRFERPWWPCRIVDTVTDNVYTDPEDGMVSSARIDSTIVTVVAGCARVGTDVATAVLQDEIVKEPVWKSIVKGLALTGAGVIGGVLIARRK